MFILLICALAQVPDTMMIGEVARRPVVSADGLAWHRVGAPTARDVPTVKSGLVWGKKRPDGLVTWEPTDQAGAWAVAGRKQEPLVYHVVDQVGVVWESTNFDALMKQLEGGRNRVPVYSPVQYYWSTPKVMSQCVNGQCPAR